MRTYVKILVLFSAASAIILVVYAARQATAPVSAIIAKERSRLSRSIDRARAAADPAYALTIENKLRFLGERLALAYLDENRPAEAIAVLEGIISGLQARETAGGRRNARSYLDEAHYLEMLIKAYEAKKDEAGAKRAAKERAAVIGKAADVKKQERISEGVHVGSPVD